MCVIAYIYNIHIHVCVNYIIMFLEIVGFGILSAIRKPIKINRNLLPSKQFQTY